MTTSKRTAILLIEDSLSDARLIKESLRDAPHERFSVLTASTLAKGLHKLERDDVDAILLDLALPDCDGIDTFHAVRKRKPSLPVIVLTMTDDGALGLQLIREGAQDYLPKTVLTQETCTAALTRAIRYAIERKCADEQMEALNDRLHAANKELYALNQELRRGVQERTEELASANKELRILNEELRHETQARTNAERAAQAHAHYLDMLNRVIRAGNEAATLQAALSAMVSTALELTDLDSGVVFLLNDAQGVTELQYEQGYPAERVELIQRLSLSLHSMARIYRGEPIFMEDHRKEVTPEYMVSGMASAIGIPLIAGERIIGHYGAISVRQRHFTTEEREMLITLGREAGTVIARLLAEEATMEHARRQDILTHIISAGNSTTSLQAASVAMLDTALELLSLENGGIFLRDGDAMTLQYERGYTAEQRAWSQRIPITQPRIARIMEGTPWISDDYQADVTPEVRAMNRGVASMATVPLTAGDAVVGFYQLVSVRYPHYFTDEERGLLVAIGREAGTVIARLQAEDLAKAHAHRTAILNEIIHVLNEAPDLQTLYERAVTTILEQFGFESGIVATVSDTGTLVVEYACNHPSAFIEAINGLNVNENAYTRVLYQQRELVVWDESPSETASCFHLSSRGAAVGIPFLSEGNVAGHLSLHAADPRSFTLEEQELFRAVGLEFGTAVARLRAKEDLSESEARYRSLVERNFDGVIIHSEGVIRYANDAAAHIAKASSPHELIGRSAFEISTPEYRELMKQRVQEIYRTRKSSDLIEIQMNALDGTIVDIELSGALMTYEGKPAIYVVARDISERKQMEAQLKQYANHLEDLVEERTAQLKDAERLAAIGQTAAMIGHDLRNPLQALQLTVDLGHTLFGSLPPEVKGGMDSAKVEKLFSSVEQQIKYMDKIVSDLQDYARPLSLERQKVSVPALINATLSTLTIPRTITAHVKISDSITATVDPYLMQRALANLMINAVQAMPQGGELTIGATAENHAVVIRIHDTGEGVPENMKDVIFSPLTTGKAKGTGLGLAVVKRIVEAHNGTITFASEEGKGTTFTVTLPQPGE